MTTSSESVKLCYPTAVCALLPKNRYARYREYLVYVDGDEELSLGVGKSAASAWKDAWEMVQYMTLWELEK